MRVIATIEARMASTRLPGKVLFPLAGAPMLERLVERVRRAKLIDEIVVASTVSSPDEVIADLCARIDCRVYRGSVDDVTERLLNAAEGADVVVQLTGDCPLIDPEHVDETVRRLTDARADYASNSLNGCTFPLGLDVRAFTMEALRRSAKLTEDPIDRVHGSYFICRNPQLFQLIGWDAPSELRWPELRLTVDEPADYELVRRVFWHLYPAKPDFDTADVVALLRKRPDWVAINSAVRQKTLAEG